MTYSNDIYLFFDPKDNQVQKDGEAGWADNFIRFLTIMLKQFIGREPVFLKTEQQVPDMEQLKDVKIIVFILSPASLQSQELVKLIDDFKSICDRDQSGGKSFAARTYKIVKFPVSLGDQPETIRGILPYDLYDYDPVVGKTHEIDNFFSRDAELNYWMKLVDLAYDMNEVLSVFDSGSDTVKKQQRKNIFLAETGPELIVQRNMVKRELLRQGFNVLPNHNLAAEQNTVNQQIGEILKECDFSIHLMGDHATTSFKGEHSIVEVQNNAVSKFIRETPAEQVINFSRFIWLSPNFRVKDEKQQVFLEKVRRELEEVGHTEIFQTPFEDFRFILKNALIGSKESDLKIDIELKSGSRKKLYLLYDKNDSVRAKQLATHMNQKGVEVIEPSFEGDLMDIRMLHIQHLIDFDAAVIFAGKVNELWVKMKLLDILKSPGFGRMKSLENKAVYIDEPGKFSSSGFSDYQVDVIEKGNSDFRSVDEFISKI